MSLRSESRPLPSSPPAAKDAVLSRRIPHPKRHLGNRSAKSLPSAGPDDFPIIVHCHLCWDWVWQRPQQFISRLSRRHRVLFVETVGPDPELGTALTRFRTVPDWPGITVMRIQFPSWRWNDAAYVDGERRRMVKEVLEGPLCGQFNAPVQWFYDPMAVTAFAGYMGEIATVYDCMDELSKFRFAPPEIHLREMELLARADVVFTGGRKLHEAKSRFHKNCHCYGCGVDWEHFGRALRPETPVPAEIAALPKPVLGYFGVVDERLDYELLASLANAHPEWSLAVVGPVLKVEEQSLPRRANIHYFGQRSYQDLPALCKGFDLCLLPFALNEATEFINPTKTLEYMAAGRPIVSTAITDVIRNFGEVVQVAQTREGFIQLCQETLRGPDARRIRRGLDLARQNSWESIVARLEEQVRATIDQRKRISATPA